MKPTRWVLGLFLLVSLVLIVAASQVSFFADSELWSIALSRFFISDFSRASNLVKIPFQFILWCVASAVEIAGFDDVVLDRACRLLMVVNAVTVLIFVYRFAKRLLGSSEAALFACVSTAASVSFFSQICRVRADALATSFALWALLALIGRRYISAYVAILMSLLTTPKSVYFLIAFAAAHICVANSEVSAPRFQSIRTRVLVRMRTSLALQSAFAATFILLAILLSQHHQAVLSAYETAFEFFSSLFHEQVGVPAYLSKQSFIYLNQSLVREPWLYVAPGLLMALEWAKVKRGVGDRRVLSVAAFALTTLVTMVLHNDKLPFFIASRMPFLSLCFAILVCRYALPFFVQLSFTKTMIQSRFGALVMVTVACGAMVCLPSFRLAAIAQANDNREQLKVIHSLSAYVRAQAKATRQSVAYFDGMAALPLEVACASDLHFIGPGQTEANKAVMSAVEAQKPQLIFYSAKLGLVREPIAAILDSDYLHLQKGIFAQAEKANVDLKIDQQVRRGFMITHDEWLKQWRKLNLNFEPKTVEVRLVNPNDSKRMNLAIVSRDGIYEKRQVERATLSLEDDWQKIWVNVRDVEWRVSRYSMPELHTSQSFTELFRFDGRF